MPKQKWSLRRLSRRQWLVLAGLAVAGLIALILFPSNRNVTIAGGGFNPEQVTVWSGDSVTWSSSGASHWPASNAHPTHGDYSSGDGCIGSQLDACKPLEAGQSYTFRFDKTGTWGIHDHLNPGLGMSVKVRSRWLKPLAPYYWLADRSKPRVSALYSNAERVRLMDQMAQRRHFTALSEQNPKEAWELLKAAFIVNGQVTANVHDLAHLIGNAAYRKDAVKGINACDASFAHGCYHGVTEEALKQLGSAAIGKIETACIETLGKEIGEPIVGCMHGTGHGILSNQKYVLADALKTCESLSKEYRTYCYDGVFMEYVNGAPNLKVETADPWQMCRGILAEHEYACAKYMPTVIATRGSNLRPGQICQAAPNANMRTTCFSAIGYQMAQIHQGDPEKVRQGCLQSAPEDLDQCLLGAAQEVAFQRYGDFQRRVEAICNFVREEKRQSCRGA